METLSPARKRGLMAVSVVLVLMASMIMLAPASSAANPPGNNGTVKIDGEAFDDHPDNEPHVGCVFQVDFYGYDEGDLFADVTFTVHPPTGPFEVVLEDEVFIRALLRVSDFERSVEFYERVLGFRRLTGWKGDTGSGAVLEASNGETLELLGSGTGLSWPHPTGVELGFFVDDVQAWHDHLAAAGVSVTRDLKIESWGDTVFGVDDPDGVRIWFGQVR